MKVDIVRHPRNDIKRGYRKFFFGCVISAFAAITLNPTVCAADVADYYVKLSCDLNRKIVTIENYIVYEGEGQMPIGAEPLSAIGKGDGRKASVAFCNIGEKRQISVSGVVNLDRPTYNKVEIYTGTRPTPLNVYIADSGESDSVRISAASSNYALSIQVCSKDGHCQTQLRSDPSFDCRISKSEVDRIICRSDDLSLLDATLFGKFPSESMRPTRHTTLPGNPESWREKAFRRCSMGVNINMVSCISSQYDSLKADNSTPE